MTTGTVQSLWRWPVTPLAGERLRTTRVDYRGVAGDRRHLLAGPHGPLTAEDAPGLTAWRAEFPFNPDGAMVGHMPPYPIVHAPGGEGRYRWGDPRLRLRLEHDAGTEIEFMRETVEVQPVVVAASPPGVDPRLAGVNVQLEIDLPPGGWAGRELRFAEGVRLRLISSRADGPGIETRVVIGGRIVIGETVTLG
jgi:MOSC N-terminal beta barrel domain